MVGLATVSAWFLVSGCTGDQPSLTSFGQSLCDASKGDVNKGLALYNGDNCVNEIGCTFTCLSCHGNPSSSCDRVGDDTCFPCNYPTNPEMGLNVALYGARKGVLKSYVDGEEGMDDFSPQEAQQMFADLGIVTDDDLNDLAAYLASADPNRYEIRGTISLQDEADAQLVDILVCSTHLGELPKPTISVSPSNPKILTYVVADLQAGEYTLTPTPILTFEPANRDVAFSFVSSGCSKVIQGVDFEPILQRAE
jgi:hypothetical protein